MVHNLHYVNQGAFVNKVVYTASVHNSRRKVHYFINFVTWRIRMFTVREILFAVFLLTADVADLHVKSPSKNLTAVFYSHSLEFA